MNDLEILWSADAADSFNDILDYIVQTTGRESAERIYQKVITAVERLAAVPLMGKIVADLKDIGIDDVLEIHEGPWRIFYRVKDDRVFILTVIDGRRNIQELLINKVINNKI